MAKKKAPGVFRKEIKTKKWNKKIIKNVHIPSDKKWLEERFELSDERMVLKKDLPSEDMKKLKALGKAIKKNKGTVTRWKGAILLTIAAVAGIFTVFFKNMLLEKGIEKGLESLFQAYSDAEEPRLSLVKGSFSMEGLSVQNKDKPGRNLFEFGRTAFSVNMGQLSRNRYHIDEITLQGLKFNSSRDSDLLPESQSSDSGDSNPPLIDIAGLGADSTEEIKNLIEEQKENLKTLTYIETANERLSALNSRWESEFKDSSELVKQSTEEIQKLTGQGTPSLTSIEEAAAAAAEYKSAYDSLESTRADLQDLNSRFKADREEFFSIKDEISTLIQEDVDYLSSLIELPDSSDLRNIVSDRIKKILMERFSDYYAMAEPFIPYYEKWRSKQATTVKKEKTRRLNGTYIPFESATEPRFLIREMTLGGGDENSGTFQGLIEGISSEPEKLNEPITLDADWSDGKSSVTLDGFLDLREDSGELFRLSFTSPGGKAEIKEGLSALGIETAEAELSYTGTGAPSPEGDGVLVSLDMTFSDLKFDMPEDQDMMGSIIQETLQDIQSFLVSSEILIDGKGIQEISVSSDIDRVLQQKLGDLISELPSQGSEMLEPYLRDMLSSQLQENEKLNSSLDALNIQSLDQINSIEALQEKVDELRNDAEDRADAIKDEIKAEADAAKAEAEAAAAKAKADAEAKAREEASKIKLPGF